MSRTLASTLDELRAVDGWLTDDQAGRLWSAAARARDGGRIVEIGSFRGRSTIVLARAAPPAAQVVAIDPHGGSDRGPGEYDPDRDRGDADHRAFVDNLRQAGVADRVRHVRLPSYAALPVVDGDAEVLYVDGAHRYRPALEDLRDWGARVRPGGTLLVHDAFSSVGVTLAQLRLLATGGEFRYVGRSGSLAEYRREALGSRRDRVVNAGRQLAELGYFARNVAVKLALTARARPVARALGSPHWPY
jgi:predicted O-methyltransferase YrrM